MKNDSMEENAISFGPHLMVDAVGSSFDILSNLELHKKFLKELPTLIGMTPIMEPVLFHYSGLVPTDSGPTGFVVIAESHISIHSFEQKGYSFIDIFSCKPFDTDKALSYINDLLKPSKLEINLCCRGKEFSRG